MVDNIVPLCYQRTRPNGAIEMATRDKSGDLLGILIDKTVPCMSITIDHNGNAHDVLLNAEQMLYIRNFINAS